MGQAKEIVRRVELLGAAADLVTSQDVLAFIDEAAVSGRKVVVANQNLHSLYLSKTDKEMAGFYARANLIEIDSMPMVLWGRLMGLETCPAHRCTYLDWRDAFWALASAKGWRVFCLGAEPGVAAEAAQRLQQEWPGVEIATHHGYFDQAPGSTENAAVVDQINAFQPHVVLVGMGMPLQEQWIARNFDALVSGALLSVGAAFDYEAGMQAAAPRVLGLLCVEWLYRLACDPRRLGHRYLVEPWVLAPAVLADLARYVLRPQQARACVTLHHIWRSDLAPAAETGPLAA